MHTYIGNVVRIFVASEFLSRNFLQELRKTTTNIMGQEHPNSSLVLKFVCAKCKVHLALERAWFYIVPQSTGC